MIIGFVAVFEAWKGLVVKEALHSFLNRLSPSSRIGDNDVGVELSQDTTSMLKLLLSRRQEFLEENSMSYGLP